MVLLCHHHTSSHSPLSPSLPLPPFIPNTQPISHVHFFLNHFTPFVLIHLPSRGVRQELRVQQGVPGARIRAIEEAERHQQDENEAHGGPGQDVHLWREKEREGGREGGKEGGREGGRKGDYVQSIHSPSLPPSLPLLRPSARLIMAGFPVNVLASTCFADGVNYQWQVEREDK